MDIFRKSKKVSAFNFDSISLWAICSPHFAFSITPAVNPIMVWGLKDPDHVARHFWPPSELNADTFWLFLNVPIDEFRPKKLIRKKFDLRGEQISKYFLRWSGSGPQPLSLIRTPNPNRVNISMGYFVVGKSCLLGKSWSGQLFMLLF